MLGRLRFIQQTWFRVLVSGLMLFLAMGIALSVTANPHLLPTVILLGAFLLPVTFVIYMYEWMPAKNIPLSTLVVTFIYGGALGLVVAGVLEYGTLRQLGVLPTLGVGLIEESAKLILPIAIYLRGKYVSEADGLLFGVASGMGFAALETMGYGFVTFVQSQGSVGSLEETLLVRGLISPAGHAAWTGLICAVLWRQRERGGHGVSNWAIIVGTFFVAVLLHTLWDTLGSLTQRTAIGWVRIDLVGLIVIGLVSLTLLRYRMREAEQAR